VSRYGLRLDSALADNLSANGVGLVLATTARWVAYRYLVFRRADPSQKRNRAQV